MLERLRLEYPDADKNELAASLGVTSSALLQKAAHFGIRKSDAWAESHHERLGAKVSVAKRKGRPPVVQSRARPEGSREIDTGFVTVEYVSGARIITHVQKGG